MGCQMKLARGTHAVWVSSIKSTKGGKVCVPLCVFVCVCVCLCACVYIEHCLTNMASNLSITFSCLPSFTHGSRIGEQGVSVST